MNSTNQQYNNIIYYDENITNFDFIKNDCDYLERHTPGAFIVCTDLESLRLVRTEILKEVGKDGMIIFNLITTGSACIKVMEFLKEDKKFENCIKNVCVYCMNLEKYISLKNQYSQIHDDIYNKIVQVVDFIKKFSGEEIKPFPLTKLITYEDYLNIYKNRHFKISRFYGDLTPESYKKFFEEMKSLIENKSKSNELIKDKNSILNGLLTFDLEKDIRDLDALIIKEYSKDSFFRDLNRLLMNNMEFYEPVAYFTARLMYALNKYAKEKNKYSKENREFYRGVQMSYCSILPYIRAKRKIINISNFVSTNEDISIAEAFAGRDNSNEVYKSKCRFSVLFYIKNNTKNNWISSGVNIQNISCYAQEKENVFLPFTFYYVRDVQIDIKTHTADIYLETIGKKEILEEEIKNGKEIEYNPNEKIIQIKEN